MGGFLALLRPGNGVVAAAAVTAGAIAAAGPDALGPALRLQVAVAAGTAFAFIGAGNALNDYFDRDIDKVAHPTRPVPSGRVSPVQARSISGGLFVAALVGALWISVPAFLLVATSAAVMIGYELRLKAAGLPGNLAIGYLSGITFLYGALVVGNPMAALFLAALGIVASVGREIAKDIEDMDADKDRNTLPQRAGKARAAHLSAAFTLAAVVLSPVPFFPLAVLGWPYLPVIAIADATFIYGALVLRHSAARSQMMSKVGMAMATLAFAMGGWVR